MISPSFRLTYPINYIKVFNRRGYDNFYKYANFHNESKRGVQTEALKRVLAIAGVSPLTNIFGTLGQAAKAIACRRSWLC
jgi:hypothetical protein